MSLAYDLVNSLAKAEVESEEDLKTLVIDHYTRTINIPKGITTLGVESDDEVLRLNFKMPRYLGTVDLYNFNIRINYINQNGDDDVYKVTDKAISGDYVTFSWLVGPTATAYKGTTKFNVCMVITDANSVIKQEYNTTVASLPVLQGLECSERIISEYTDILEQWERRLFGIGDTEEANLINVSTQQQTAIANKGAEVLATIPADYTSAVKMADEGVRTKADAIIRSAEGETIVVHDSADDPLRGLKLFGKTTQVKTTGAQKLPFQYYDSNMVRHGVTFTVNDDGSITMSGTNTATDNVSCYFMLHSGFSATGTYTYKCYGLPSNCVTNIYYRGDVVGDDAALLDLYSANEYGIVIRIPAGAKINTTVYPMLNEGDTALPYEPYSGGIPGPNPEYPMELVSVENPTIHVYSKNLLNITATTQTVNGITFTVNDDKTIVINGTATADAYCGLTQPDILNPGKYILSGCTGGSSNTYFLYTDTGAIYNRDGEVEFTIDTPSEKKFLIKVHSGVTVDNAVVKPMLRLAEVDDGTYEAPSEAQRLSLPHSLPGIPVSQNGNYTDENGQQWICDEIDFERGVYVKRTKEIALPNTFVVNENTNELWIQLNDSEAAAYNTTDVQCICTHLPGVSRQEVYDNAFVAEYRGIAVRDRFVRVVDNAMFNGNPDTLNAWINERNTAGDPVILKYILANPIETSLTADELSTFKALRANYPNTMVMNDSGAWMELAYNADTETWINNRIAETTSTADVKWFGALGDGITDDTEAFAKAIAACPENGSVYVPTGTYRVSNIALKSNMTIEGTGKGSVIKLIDNMSTFNQNCLTVNNVSNVTIRNIALDGNRTHNTSPGGAVDGGWNGIHIRSSNHVTIDNVASYSNGYHGIIMVDVSDITVTNSVFYDNGYRPIHGHDFVDNVRLSNNEVYANGKGFDGDTPLDGIFFFAGVTNLTIEGNHIHDTTSIGGIIVGGDSYNNTAPTSNISIVDNRIDNAETDVNGILVLGDGITNCTIARNTITGREGIFLQSNRSGSVNKDFVIAENTIYSCNLFGIHCINGYTNLVITNNILKTGNQFGIYLVDVKKAVVSNNNIVDFQFGIDLATCEDVNLVSNIVEKRNSNVICALRAINTSTNVKMLYNITDLLVRNESVGAVTV